MIPADSDDSFEPKTIEVFDNYWKKYKSKSISGISVLTKDEKNNINGDNFPYNGISNYFDIVYKYKVKGEKWGCIRVDVLREYKFPNMLGASFFPEGYIWTQIGLKYETVYLNIPLRIYFQDAGNQIMKEKEKSEGTLKIASFYAIWRLNKIYPKESKYLSVKGKFRRFVLIWKYSFLSGKPPYMVLKDIERYKNKIMISILFFPSYLFFKILK